ncbi:MAG: GNAT family N-acetyltransferase [Candidatus Thorarchaeota archaeon]|jgi:predicted acetyltransferase
MPSNVRLCNKEDIEAIVELSGYAYSIPDASFENFREKWDDIFKEFYLNEVDGIPVASARMIPLIQNIRGSMKSMGAIGFIAGSPEYRRKGYVRELMLKMLEDIRAKNYSVSCLYPFKDSFYGAMGYVKMPPTQNLEFDPVNLACISMSEGYSASRETGDEAQAVWREFHDSTSERIHGAAKRRNTRWKEYTAKFNRKIVIARNGEGQAEGVMVYSIKGYGEGHAWTDPGEMNIGEMHWLSLEGRDTLLHYIYGHADQIKKVKYQISSVSEDYYQWLCNYHTPTISSRIISMARIIDVKSSLQGLRVYTPGSLTLRITDSHFEWNNNVFRIFEEDGVLRVEESQETTETTLTIEGLTAILYGTLSPKQLNRLGWLQGDVHQFTGKSVTTEDGKKYRGILYLDDWFPRTTPWLTEDF